MTAGESVLVELDPQGFREIVGNLLDNARRHAVSRIEVSVDKGGDAVLVRVCDDGRGLPPGAESRAFEPFVSLDGQGGSGLGLAVSEILAQAHGGTLTYEGGAFVLRLPDHPARGETRTR